MPRSVKAATGPTANAPSITLPLRFMIAGLMALSTGVIWLIAQPSVLTTYHYNQNVIALTHLFVLGWICTVVMGAMYQLVPVALETKLFSERLAKWQFVFHVIGFVGMVWMFRRWNMTQVGHFGSALTFGVALFIYNLIRTLARVPKWNVIATGVASALGWLTFAVLAGLSLAAAKISFDPDATPNGTVVAMITGISRVVRQFEPLSAMHAHAHLGAIGFFIMLIVGVSYKLVPMFMLSEIQNHRRALVSIVLLNLGLIGTFFTILYRSPLKPVFALLVTMAFIVYGWELIAIVRARKRQPIDWGIRYFLTAVALLAPLSILGVVLSWPRLPLNAFTGQLENVYGFLGLIGVISFAIMGMLYKIVPFLVWFGVYSRHIGKAKVPALAEMYSARWQAVGYWTFLVGLVITIATTLRMNPLCLRIGGGFLAVSVASLLVNVASVIKHFFRPQLRPFAAPASAVGNRL
ncbi:MAG TPA: cbb3-type cytochrome c oxidase subunit I [Verrucomicrobiae bacterium]|nr:cbb3-type cytochrome c oxidase subunit I [Verrucomicrobiae bacterium]